MSHDAKISVVIPVRDSEDRVADRVRNAIKALEELTQEASEVVVVDDGSKDATPDILLRLASEFPQLRIARHSRPRGMEAAGQTGLERAIGELVFIQERDCALRIDDLKRLYKMSSDPSVVAARAESTPRPLSDELLRRLKAWGAATNENLEARACNTEKSSLQMICRPHLQRLASPTGPHYRLEASTTFATSLETVAS